MKKGSKTHTKKPYTRMTTAELREATREFDLPTRGDFIPGRPLTASQRARFERARTRGRPRVGKGAKAISLTVERGLLKEADRRAKSAGISRAELVSRALHAMFKRAG